MLSSFSREFLVLKWTRSMGGGVRRCGLLSVTTREIL